MVLGNSAQAEGSGLGHVSYQYCKESNSWVDCELVCEGYIQKRITCLDIELDLVIFLVLVDKSASTLLQHEYNSRKYLFHASRTRDLTLNSKNYRKKRWEVFSLN